MLLLPALLSTVRTPFNLTNCHESLGVGRENLVPNSCSIIAWHEARVPEYVIFPAMVWSGDQADLQAWKDNAKCE